MLGPGVGYLSRRSPRLPGWAPTAAGAPDFQTGLQLPVAGSLPYIACAGVVTPDALSLYRAAGLVVEAQVVRYRTVGEFDRALVGFREAGIRIALQSVHPEAEVPGPATLVQPGLLRDLNNKGRMGDLVPSEALPRREALTVRELTSRLDSREIEWPLVLKVASDRPNGGGHAVWMAERPEQARRGLAVLEAAGETEVVVEEWLPLERSVCVHAVVRPDGSCQVVGAAEEVCTAGQWQGNWVDPGADAVPPRALDLAEQIVSGAAARGYRGLAGIDIALCSDGRILALDLNFRVCGSTTAVWLRPWLETMSGVSTFRVGTWIGRDGYPEMVKTVRLALDKGILIPFGVYDPGACAFGGEARIGGVLVGSSRDEALQNGRWLAERGLAGRGELAFANTVG